MITWLYIFNYMYLYVCMYSIYIAHLYIYICIYIYTYKLMKEENLKLANFLASAVDLVFFDGQIYNNDIHISPFIYIIYIIYIYIYIYIYMKQFTT